MHKQDLSIGYEIAFRPEMGIQECIAKSYGQAKLPDGFRLFHQELWSTVKEFTLLGDLKGYVIYKHAEAALQLPGDFVEFGCFRGGLSYMLGLMAQRAKPTKSVFMCDNFDGGLPVPDRSVDKAYTEGTMTCPVQMIHQNILQLGLESQCFPIPGLFSETLNQFPDDQRFAMAHIDCDLYQGTRECLEFVYPRLTDAAPVIMDDYSDESHGVMTAMHKFAELYVIVIHISVHGQAYWIKGELPEDTDASKVDIDGNSVWLTADAARREPVYLDYLQSLLEDRQERVDRLQKFINFCRGE